MGWVGFGVRTTMRPRGCRAISLKGSMIISNILMTCLWEKLRMIFWMKWVPLLSLWIRGVCGEGLPLITTANP